MTSKLFTLQLNDVEKALIVAVLTPVAGYLGRGHKGFFQREDNAIRERVN
jgi:hypothetical protein